MGWQGTQASPVLLVDSSGALNTTYLPYAVLAALGYGTVALAGVHAYNLWSPVLRSDSLSFTPDEALAADNRVVMSNWLRKNVGDPGKSPALEAVRKVVSPYLPKRRTDDVQSSPLPAARPGRPSKQPQLKGNNPAQSNRWRANSQTARLRQSKVPKPSNLRFRPRPVNNVPSKV
ncbi:hypothetical protein SK128_023915 [Halocaridina rubra]|uniref:Uncharacterized protein n=1 Tax=Halocaridina rubra TaxID=373956 RepID=A0AAN8X8D9_HALRR